jgi:hypothetical protein
MVTHHPSCMVPCWWVFASLNLDKLRQLSFIHWGAELMKKVGWGSGFVEGWLKLRGSQGKGGVASGRERQLHNFTILHTDECYGTRSVVSY